MKIRRSNYENTKSEMHLKGFELGREQGRQEITDVLCDHIGTLRKQVKNNPAAHNGLLHAQAVAESFRLLAYLYDETSVKAAVDFQWRFYNARRQESLAIHREALNDELLFTTREGERRHANSL